jgi:hypothetical protein
MYMYVFMCVCVCVCWCCAKSRLDCGLRLPCIVMKWTSLSPDKAAKTKKANLKTKHSRWYQYLSLYNIYSMIMKRIIHHVMRMHREVHLR